MSRPREGWPARHLRPVLLPDGTLEVWGGSCGPGVRVLVVQAGDGKAFAEKLGRAVGVRK